jgi:hypothetical protein
MLVSLLKRRSLLFLIPALMVAQSSSLTGKWFVAADFYGTTLNFSLDLSQQENKLTGNFDGDKLEGTFTGKAIHFLAKDEHGGSEELTGTVQGGGRSGTIIFTATDDKDHPTAHPFTATRATVRRTGSPQRHEFTPSTFYRQFSAANRPVATVFPGDIITACWGLTDDIALRHGVARLVRNRTPYDPKSQLPISSMTSQDLRNNVTRNVQPLHFLVTYSQRYFLLERRLLLIPCVLNAFDYSDRRMKDGKEHSYWSLVETVR